MTNSLSLIKLPDDLIVMCDESLNLGTLPDQEQGQLGEVLTFLDKGERRWAPYVKYADLRKTVDPEYETIGGDLFWMYGHIHNSPESPILYAVCEREGHWVNITQIGYFDDEKKVAHWLGQQGLAVDPAFDNLFRNPFS